MRANAGDSQPAPLDPRMRAAAQVRPALPPLAWHEPPGRLQPIPLAGSARLPQPAGTRGPAPTRLPLYHRPGSVVLVDDDADYLEMLVGSLPRHWNIEAFAKAHACVNHLQQEPPRWEADFWAQQKIVENWHKGTPLIPQIIDYWAGKPERYALTKVCVFDHHMPGMTGLQAIGELVDWPGHRILLTGDTDERLATDAFNRGLIDQFITKQSPHMASQLANTIQLLMQRPNPRFHQIWSATLSPEQQAMLREQSVAEDLANFASRTFAEWVVIGEPFGVLGISEGGIIFWLQLQPASGLGELAQLAQHSGASREDVDHIRAGRCIYAGHLQQVLGRAKAPAAIPAFYVGDAGVLLAAIHRIDTTAGVAPWGSYRDWLAENAHRRSMNQSFF